MTPTAKEILQKAIADAGGLKSIKVGSRVFVHTADLAEKVLKDARKLAMQTGDAIERDGTRESYTWEDVAGPGQSGSARYVWSKDGERVKARLVKIFVDQEGRMERTVLKTAFRKFE